MTTLELVEEEATVFPQTKLTHSDASAIVSKCAHYLKLDSIFQDQELNWRLSAGGWVGYIPVSSELAIRIRHKVPLRNIFSMWEYAYRLKSFKFLGGLFETNSLEEFYEQLAFVLANRVLSRGKKGFYREYITHRSRLPFVRGRLESQQLFKTPWMINLECRFHEQKADIPDNQILTWTLFTIARSGKCSQRVLPTVRRAYRNTQNFTSLVPYNSRACVGRSYNRLNEDYRGLHALCRFFLDLAGPQHNSGDREMIPFVVNMPQLYQLFVCEWLKFHLPKGILLTEQERVEFGPNVDSHFNIDLVLSSAKTGKTLCIIDTKYKRTENPSPDDIAQAVAYAVSKKCQDAVLAYPIPITFNPISIGEQVRIRCVSFRLDRDLEDSGQAFLAELLEIVNIS